MLYFGLPGSVDMPSAAWRRASARWWLHLVARSTHARIPGCNNAHSQPGYGKLGRMPAILVYTSPMAGIDDLTDDERAAIVTALRRRSTATAIRCRLG